MELPNVETARAKLLEMMAERAFERREVTLASGRKSNFYFDSKQVTLDAVAKVEARTSTTLAGVGGLTLGADPIASAASLVSALVDDPKPAFIVRKEAKGHGTQSFLEGMRNIPDGSPVAIVEDVVTTGGSSAKAIERVRAAGYRVPLVVVLVDRLEGGRENLEAMDVELVTLFDRKDFMADAS